MRRLAAGPRNPELLILSGTWLLVVLFSATRINIPVEAANRAQALGISAIQWLVWAFAAVLIVRLDRLFARWREPLLLRLLPHVPCSLLLAALTSYISAVLTPLATTGSLAWPRPFDLLRQSWSTGFYTHVTIYWAITGVYLAYTYQRRLIQRELKAAQLERLVAESQLETLKTQLQPHFLFNSLNAISAHLERDPRLARRMLEQLGHLLRLSLEYSIENEIPLDRELAFLQNYVELQAARYAELLDVHWNIDDDASEAMVPTLILQPLVENAIVHGMSNRAGKGTILVGAWKERDSLHISVEDDGVGLPPAWSPERSTGIGLTNTRERLRWLYGDAAQSLSVSNAAAGRGVRVHIVIPFHRVEFAIPARA